MDFWALECSQNVHRECRFPLIITVIQNSKSLQMTCLQLFLNFFPNFPSVMFCWDPGTANTHLSLENWPIGGWGLRKILKNSSQKSEIGCFGTRFVFFSKFQKSLNGMDIFNFFLSFNLTLFKSSFYVFITNSSKNIGPPLIWLKYCQILNPLAEVSTDIFEWPR